MKPKWSRNGTVAGNKTRTTTKKREGEGAPISRREGELNFNKNRRMKFDEGPSEADEGRLSCLSDELRLGTSHLPHHRLTHSSDIKAKISVFRGKPSCPRGQFAFYCIVSPAPRVRRPTLLAKKKQRGKKTDKTRNGIVQRTTQGTRASVRHALFFALFDCSFVERRRSLPSVLCVCLSLSFCLPSSLLAICLFLTVNVGHLCAAGRAVSVRVEGVARPELCQVQHLLLALPAPDNGTQRIRISIPHQEEVEKKKKSSEESRT